MANYSDQEFLEFVVKSLVDNPDEVKVERTVDEMGVLLRLSVSPEDMAQIIGKKGSTASAIRTLLRIVGLKNNSRVNLKIEEPEGGRVQKESSGESEAPAEGGETDAPEESGDVEEKIGNLE